MLENIFTLFMLILLQLVLGFDNLLYISIESKSAPPDKQNYVRKLGIGGYIDGSMWFLVLFLLLKAT